MVLGFIIELSEMESTIQLIFDVLLVFLIFWYIPWEIKRGSSPQSIQKKLDELEGEMSELRSKLTTHIVDIHDYVDGTLVPLHKRLVTRARRLKESDADEDQETSKKPTDPFDSIRKLQKGSGALGLS